MVSWTKAVLLDLDDTILAFDSVSDASWMTVCDRYASRLEALGVDDVFSSIKAAAHRFWQDTDRQRWGRLDLMTARRSIVEEALLTYGGSDASLARDIAVEYDVERTAAIHPIVGATETIHMMRAARVKLALITNGAGVVQRAKIDRFHLGSLFDCIFIEEECGFGKPDERAYLQALSHLSVLPSDTWMVGDNWEWEVVAPQKLGIRSIWVNHAQKSTPAGAEVQPFGVIRSLADLQGHNFS